MLYFIGEVFHRLANQNRGHIHVMLESALNTNSDYISSAKITLVAIYSPSLQFK